MRTVPKPWGREVWYANTPDYMGKVLYVNAGHRLSLQYHEHKDESSLLLHGEAVLTQGSETRQIYEGHAWHNPPGLVHTIEALADCVVLEVSTPHPDDVVRLDDLYGRAAA